jgi:CRP-like cAMP-binding protein
MARIVPVGSKSSSSTGKMSSEWTPILHGLPLFAGLNNRHLKRLEGIARTKRFPRSSTVVKRGDPGDAFYVVLEGSVAVRTGSRKSVMGVGEFFGEMSLIDGAPRSASVVAESEVLLMVIPRNAFLKLLESEPKITLAILGTLSQRIRVLQAAGSL